MNKPKKRSYSAQLARLGRIAITRGLSFVVPARGEKQARTRKGVPRE